MRRGFAAIILGFRWLIWLLGGRTQYIAGGQPCSTGELGANGFDVRLFCQQVVIRGVILILMVITRAEESINLLEKTYVIKNRREIVKSILQSAQTST